MPVKTNKEILQYYKEEAKSYTKEVRDSFLLDNIRNMMDEARSMGATEFCEASERIERSKIDNEITHEEAIRQYKEIKRILCKKV